MPRVSVVIPTFNRSDYLMEAIESVRQQTYTDYEIIVVDDGSTDDTREVLAPLHDVGTIRYIYQQKQNQSAARNNGVRQATGEYIAFLDSDDLFVSTKLEKQVAYLDKHPKVGFVHCWYSKFDNAGNHLGTRDTSKYSGWVYPGILLSWSVLMATPCMVMPVKVFEEVGCFDVNQHWGEDIDIWRRITQRYPIGLVPEVLTKVRVHPGNQSKSKAKPIVWFEDYLEKTFRDDPSLSSIFRRRVTAALYSNVAVNQLENNVPDVIRQIRELSLKAILTWPFLPTAYIGLLVSFIPPDERMMLLEKFRSWRNPNKKEP